MTPLVWFELYGDVVVDDEKDALVVAIAATTAMMMMASARRALEGATHGFKDHLRAGWRP